MGVLSGRSPVPGAGLVVLPDRCPFQYRLAIFCFVWNPQNDPTMHDEVLTDPNQTISGIPPIPFESSNLRMGVAR